MEMGRNKKTVEILKYFLLCEYLNPTALEKISGSDSNSKTFREFDTSLSELNQKLSQNLTDLLVKNTDLKKPEKREKLTLKLAVYGGIFEILNIRDCIVSKLDIDKEKQDNLSERKSGKAASYFIEFSVDKNKINFIQKNKFSQDEINNLFIVNKGLILNDESFSLSTTPWAVENFNDLTNKSFDDFTDFKKNIVTEIYSKINTPQNISEFLKGIEHLFIDKLPIINNLKSNTNKENKTKRKEQGNNENIPLRVEIKLVKEDDKNHSGIINSFFINDILKLINLYGKIIQIN